MSATMIRPGIDRVAFDRLLDLVNWVAETGRPLPLPADVILAYEARGMAVNLETGEVESVPVDEAPQTAVA
jgi:hypothetical protein